MDLASGTKLVENGAEDPPDPDVIETDPTGRYTRYREVLGRGAFKTVYKGFDEVDGIEVAWNKVKIDEVVRGCTHDLESVLYAEVNLLKVVHSNHIIKMYTSWVDDDKRTVNIITELFNSGNMREYRLKHKKVDMKAVKGWAKQILLGLDYLHSHSPPIIHRDVKCDNIFINGNHGEVKIGDLGLATIMEQASLHSVLGTPEIMAPEIYDEDYNKLVDIYSFGMCMLEMVTNECPYSECTSCPQIYKKVVNRFMPAALAKVKDLETKQFIKRCLGLVAERLPAKELLKDPFLQLTDCNAAGYCYSDQLCSGSVLALPQKESNTEQRVVAENSITVVAGGSHLMPTLEVQRLKRGSEFKLKGEKEDEMSISFKLRISDQKYGVRNIDFLFYLLSETALSVADEMVEQLHIADQSVVFVAELIDVLIMSLIPNWNPCVPIDQLVVTHQYAASISNHHPCFDSIMAITDTPGIDKLEHILTHADCGGARNKAAKEDRDIGTFPEKNYTDSCTNSCVCADSGFIVHNGGAKDVCADGIRLELEMIELQYQNAIEEISKKRREAITAAKHRWSSQKKMVPTY